MLLLEKKSEMVFEKYDVLVPFYVQLYFISMNFFAYTQSLKIIKGTRCMQYLCMHAFIHSTIHQMFSTCSESSGTRC